MKPPLPRRPDLQGVPFPELMLPCTVIGVSLAICGRRMDFPSRLLAGIGVLWGLSSAIIKARSHWINEKTAEIHNGREIARWRREVGRCLSPDEASELVKNPEDWEGFRTYADLHSPGMPEVVLLRNRRDGSLVGIEGHRFSAHAWGHAHGFKLSPY